MVDEWPDAASFMRSFESSPDIGEMMGEAGVTEQPTPVFRRELDAPDALDRGALRAPLVFPGRCVPPRRWWPAR